MRYALAACALLLCSAVFTAPPDVGQAEAARRLRVKAEAEQEEVRQEVKAAPEPKKGKKQPALPIVGAVLSTADAVKVCHADAAKLRLIDEAGARAHAKLREQGVAGLGEYRYLLPEVRYFWFPPDPEEYENFLITEKLHKNILSTQPEFCTPTLIAPNVFRIDVRELGWGERQKVLLEKFAAFDVYFHAKKTYVKAGEKYVEHWPGGEFDGEHYDRGVHPRKTTKGNQTIDVPAPWLPEQQIDELREWLYTEVPILNAEHFYLNTVRQVGLDNKEVRGVGYYEWFGEKKPIKTRADYFEVLGLVEKLSIDKYKEWRAVVESRTSGVANNGRQIGALNAVTGPVWFTLDVFDESSAAKGLVKDRLERGELKHNAEEWYGHLPNGLPLTGLFDDKGKVQAQAPPQVGGDRSSLNVGSDTAIHSNLSCMRCHGSSDMLRTFKDYVRGVFQHARNPTGYPLEALTFDVKQRLTRQYLSDVEKLLDLDQKAYADAVASCTTSARHPNGLSCTVAARIYCETWNRLAERDPVSKKLQPVTLAVAAREIGTTPEDYVAKLKTYHQFRKQLDPVLVTFLKRDANGNPDPGALSREEWESRYAFSASLMLGQAFPEELRKEKKE